MEEKKIDVKKIIENAPEAQENSVPQVNLDGSPITDKRYFRLPGDRFGIYYHGDKVKVVDHQPTPNDLKISALVAGTTETGKKAAATMKARKTAQDSLRFLLSCSAEPAEARALVKTLTGGEMSQTMRNFFEAQDGDESDLTQYDLVNLAMVTAAKQGDTKAAQYVRDTMGDKIAEKTEISATITDGDRSLLEKVNVRLALLADEYLTQEDEK